MELVLNMEEAIQCPDEMLDPRPGDPGSGDSAIALVAHFKQLGRIEDLNKAINYHREELNLCYPGHPKHSNAFMNISAVLSTRFKQVGQIQDLDKAIGYNREALELRPEGHPLRSDCLNNLAASLYIRFSQLGRMKDLQEAVRHLQEALNLRPKGHPGRSSSLNNFAIVILARFQQSGNRGDLEEAIKRGREALDLCPQGHDSRSDSLNNLAACLSSQFWQLGQMEDLEEAIKYNLEALDLRPQGHPSRPDTLNNLAACLSSRYGQLGRVEDLEKAIGYYREALGLRPTGYPGRVTSLNNFAIVLRTRYQQFGEKNDLEEAIQYDREALGLCYPGYPIYANSLSSNAADLLAQFKRLGGIKVLQKAIESDTEALSLRPKGHPSRSESLNNLAEDLSTRFDQLGQIKDLEKAIEYLREAVDLRPKGHPSRSYSLDILANAVSTRFQQLGEIEDLEEAIKHLREALDLRPLGHPGRANSLNHSAIVLVARFKQLNQMEDLEKAIEYHREALSLHPIGHPSRSDSLSNLAAVLHTRFKQLAQQDNLEEAIKHHREALGLRPEGHSSRFDSLNNLSVVFLTRFQRSGDKEDLEEASKFGAQALGLCYPGHPNYSEFFCNLANIAIVQFGQSNQIGHLNDAISHYYKAGADLPDEHPLHASLKASLASAFLKHYNIIPKPDRLNTAFNLFKTAANYQSASSNAQFDAAHRWALAAREYHHNSTITAYSRSLALLDRCLIVNPTVELQHKFLSSVPPFLATDAASAAIEEGKLQTAVELLEQGRAILWSRMRGYRSSLDKLREVDEGLAVQFEKLSAQLEYLAMSSESTTSAVSFEIKLKKQRDLSNQWDGVVQRIRQKEDFANFLKSAPFTTLQTVAAEGPVIIVNTNKYRSDAIILHHSPTESVPSDPVLVPLTLSPQMLNDLCSQLSDAVQANFPARQKRVLPILRALWKNVVQPITDQLVTLEVAKDSRVWWCPTSQLCALPMHAAGPYDGKKGLPDMFISSYTPTLSALMRTRTVKAQKSSLKLLVIAQPGPTLPTVKDEIVEVQKLGKFVDALIGEEASSQTVISGLQQHTWAHFACHGHRDRKGRPFHSSFELYEGERMTLLDLIKAKLPKAEFAFLSACHSAAGESEGTADEVIHLAAALQFSGFHSVVGTLWAMVDEDGPHVTRDFYRYIFPNGGNMPDFRDSAKALHLAIKEMRKRRVPLDRWINFIHIGA